MSEMKRVPAGHPSGHGGRFADVDYSDPAIVRMLQTWQFNNCLPATGELDDATREHIERAMTAEMAGGTIDVTDPKGN